MQTLEHWLEDSPFHLAMSSGFFSFFAHAGMLQSLESAQHLPTSLSGSSAGALVAGLWAAGMSSEQISHALQHLKRSEFWDPKPGLGLLAGHLFHEKLRDLLPVQTFAQCRVPLFISAFDVRQRSTVVLDEGDLASAIGASCAFPLLFHPVQREGRLLSDGGIADRPGLACKPKTQRILYHHIASKSPWRRAGSKALQIPKEKGMVSLQINNLPRANPFRLERGLAAMEVAKHATQKALQRPIQDQAIIISAV